jgi:hypothetical protein
VLDAHGEKLSKSHGAAPVDVCEPLTVLRQAGTTLGVGADGDLAPAVWLARAVSQWRATTAAH